MSSTDRNSSCASAGVIRVCLVASVPTEPGLEAGAEPGSICELACAGAELFAPGWGVSCCAQVVLDSMQPMATHNAQNLRSEEHTSELQSRGHLVCRLLLEKKKKKKNKEKNTKDKKDYTNDRM